MIEPNLNLGVVGVGHRGAELIRSFDALEGCKVSKICDSSLSQLMFVREWFPHIPVTADYDDLLQDESIQAIVVATPLESRYVQANASLRSGKHVLLEAPASPNSRQADDLVETAANLHRVIGVGHTVVYQPVISEIRTLLDLGQVGKLCYMASEHSRFAVTDTADNVIWDLATEDVAVALYLADEPAISVTAVGQNYVHDSLVDAASLQINFESGRFSQHSVNWLPSECRHRFRVGGSEGSIRFEGIGDEGKLFLSGHEIGPGDCEVGADGHVASHSVEITPSPREGNPSALTLECADFLDSVRFDKELFASGKLGRDVVKVLEAADRSMRQNSVTVEIC